MTKYKATPEQWAYQEQWASNLFAPDQDAACLLELRSKVKNLEENLSFTVETVSSTEESVLELQEKVDILADFADQVVSKICSKPSPNKRQIRSSDHIGDTNKMVDSSAGLTRSLVERVVKALDEYHVVGALDESWETQARAAIREVAAWLSENSGGTRAAWMLEQEAKR